MRPVFLIGFMGSGKTTWGKKIARAMDLPFIDLDQEIVQKIGMSISEYFKIHGEDSFRIIEQQILHDQKDKSAIISTGGGVPCYFDNMDWILQHGTALYLQHSPKSLWDRLIKSDVNKRPALKGLNGEELLAFIETKLGERTPFYNRAHLTVDQINTSLEQLIEIIHAHHIRQK